ncbi:putative glutathione S-transferase [Xylaria cf. heliscus]|nr:putative glutathione S-transferase [Xylaria cf. heliscus]
MANSKIILFDLPSKDPNDPHAWSLNTWKTRLILNYKGLDYETEWLEYPEIRPRLEPHLPGREDYTVPTIKLPDGTYIMDSKDIAAELEKLYPEPAVHYDEPFRQRYVSLLSDVFVALRPLYLLGVPNKLLKEVNHAYWNRTRGDHVGMPIEQFAKENPADVAWKNAAAPLQGITALLKENKGPFFLGDTMSYVDFNHVGFLIMFRALGDEIWKPLQEGFGDAQVHLKLMEDLKPWTDRDNY